MTPFAFDMVMPREMHKLTGGVKYNERTYKKKNEIPLSIVNMFYDFHIFLSVEKYDIIGIL